MASRQLPPYPGRRPPPPDPVALPAIPPRAEYWERQPEYITDAMQYFTRWPEFEFVRLVGSPGISGGAWLFNERRARPNTQGGAWANQFVSTLRVTFYHIYHVSRASLNENRNFWSPPGPENFPSPCFYPKKTSQPLYSKKGTVTPRTIHSPRKQTGLTNFYATGRQVLRRELQFRWLRQRAQNHVYAART